MNIFVLGNPGSNLGDEAAMKGIVYGIRRVCPNDKLFVSYGDISNVESIEKLVNGFYNNKDFLSKKNFIPFVIKVLLNSNNDIIRTFRNSDIIVFAPGFCGLHKNNNEYWYKINIILTLCRILKKKTMFHGCSMGPFEKKQSNRLRKILNKVDIITLRDSTSLSYINDMSLNLNKNLLVTSDSALMMPIEKMGRDINKEKLVLGVTPIHLSFFKEENFKNGTNVIVSSFADAINYLYHSGNLKMVKFIYHIVNSEEEDYVVNQIIEKLDKSIAYEILRHDSAEEAIDSYNEVDICIAARHHSGAFALVKDVPAVCIAYEHKAHGFFMQADLDEYVVDMIDLNSEILIDRLNLLIDNNEEIKEKIRKHIPIMINNSFKNAYILKNHLYDLEVTYDN